ncbi:hypothetical protein [Magnetospirillum sp. UT-4]|uniref:hypothetical protein n=1 Tax=Magnetospirillum sp. UT-4 TaxID=2681467 RepID=UPI00137E520F|nr:hypothetical protein [Magnetospirillum sp. UT-4]CAA7616056.1 exported hypothetical protein [Magnetospirillum sp. UT-4]
MGKARKYLIYLASAVILAAFSPVLPFRYLAAAGVILVGLLLIDLVQSGRRR